MFLNRHACHLQEQRHGMHIAQGHAAHAGLNLAGVAADHVHTAMQFMPADQRVNLCAFCACLNAGCG